MKQMRERLKRPKRRDARMTGRRGEETGEEGEGGEGAHKLEAMRSSRAEEEMSERFGIEEAGGHMDEQSRWTWERGHIESSEAQVEEKEEGRKKGTRGAVGRSWAKNRSGPQAIRPSSKKWTILITSFDGKRGKRGGRRADFGLNGELGDGARRVHVAQLVVEVLDHLLEDRRLDLTEVDLAHLALHEGALEHGADGAGDAEEGG